MSLLKVLILEDQISDAELVKYHISSLDFTFDFRFAQTEKQFKEVLENFTPDIILSDYRLDGYDGLRALSHCSTVLPNVPFLIVTGTLGEELAVKIIKQGAIDFILKDKLETLPAAILKALRETKEKKLKLKSQKKLQNTLKNLEKLVKKRTLELEDKNAKLIIANEQAEKSKKIKEQFMANMSHELRTPLNAIIGYQELLKETPLNSEQREFVTSIDFAGRNLLAIINDILDISKAESGKIVFENVELNINEIAHSVIDLVKIKALEKKIKIQLTFDEKIPEFVLGDSTRLSQILLNLLSNAVKFTEEGQIDLNIQLKSQGKNSVNCEFVVKDTGIGISPQHIDHIFERFTQAGSDTNRKYGGTGLGLTIVQQLVELQGGKIGVKSEMGKGSIFTFNLRFNKMTEREIIQHKLTIENVENIENCSILVAEDVLINQHLIKKIIEKWNAEYVVVGNGQQVLDYLEKRPFDILLLDLHMPIMDGYETCERIRNHAKQEIRSIPIVALTADPSSVEAERCLECGMNYYLTKPFKPEHLRKVIYRMLKGNPKKHYDLSYLMDHAAGDREFMLDMINTFLDETPVKIEQLDTAISQQDYQKIKSDSHGIKGLFFTLGITRAGDLIKEIENLAESRAQLESIRERYEELKNLYLESKLALKLDMSSI